MWRMWPLKTVVLFGILSPAVYGHSFVCESYGLFPDENDCTRYHMCIEDDDGILIMGWGQCPPGQIFDPKNFECSDWASFSYPSCIEQLLIQELKYSHPVISGDEAEQKCEGYPGNVCGYCKEVISCEGEGGAVNATHMLCGDNEYCLQSISDDGERLAGCFQNIKKCQCQDPAAVELVSDKYDDRTYFRCDNSTSPPQQFYRCGPDYYFDPNSKNCRERTPCSTESLECNNTGFFVVPSDCRLFYYCYFDENANWTIAVECEECEQGEHFYPEMGCQRVGSFDCMFEGQFADVSDCHYYHLCIEMEGHMMHSHTKCPQDTHYDESSQSCIHGNECVSYCNGTITSSSFVEQIYW
ncbi:hypothetical protein SK128_024841 [Halocaridina rubra]|uniref:Chitin-binding type-2 domain-containing protein n=1 Tax=Halocaridina rubra TaxID=373956 RepID=A0AAN9A235_HALRR